MKGLCVGRKNCWQAELKIDEFITGPADHGFNRLRDIALKLDEMATYEEPTSGAAISSV